jgi:hypothetical protein
LAVSSPLHDPDYAGVSWAEEMFAEIEKGGGGNKRELVEHVIIELMRHLVAADQYLYRFARRFYPTETMNSKESRARISLHNSQIHGHPGRRDRS